MGFIGTEQDYYSGIYPNTTGGNGSGDNQPSHWSDVDQSGGFDQSDLDSLKSSSDAGDIYLSKTNEHKLEQYLAGGSVGEFPIDKNLFDKWGMGYSAVGGGGLQGMSGLTGKEIEQRYNDPNFLWQSLFDRLDKEDTFGDIWSLSGDQGMQSLSDSSDLFGNRLIDMFQNLIDPKTENRTKMNALWDEDFDPDAFTEEYGGTMTEYGDSDVYNWARQWEGMDINELMENPDQLLDDPFFKELMTGQMYGGDMGWYHEKDDEWDYEGAHWGDEDWENVSYDLSNEEWDELILRFKDEIDKMGDFDMGSYQDVIKSLKRKTGSEVSGIMNTEKLVKQKQSEDLYNQAVGRSVGRDTKSIGGGDIFSNIETGSDGSWQDRIASAMRKFKKGESHQYQEMAEDWYDQ